MDNKSSSKLINVNNKKWSLGGLFRRKKKDDASESSSEEDRKAGFTPQKRKPKSKQKPKRPNKLISAFDHIIIAPVDKSKDTDSFKSFDRVTTPTDRSTGSLDRRLRREKLRAARIYTNEVSSDEEIVSINSSSISRFRSDESIGNHSGSSCKKSRAARTERYLKRMSKGDELGQIVQQVSRWHTQPITTGFRYNEHSNNDYSYHRQPNEVLRSSSSLTNVPSQKLNQIWSVPLRSKPQELIKDQGNRSISYDNHLYRPSSQRIINTTTGPPAPPPRDPQRRLTIYNPSESRPLSYAFDKHVSNPQLLGILPSNRCASDDRLWGGQVSSIQQQQQHSHRPASVQPVQEPRRFVTRNNETEVAKNLTNISIQQGYDYLADAAPRSRRPIHVMPKDVRHDMSASITEHSPPQVRLRTTKSGVQSPMKSAADFWKQIDQAESSNRCGRNHERMYIAKPRSVSHSRAHDLTVNSWSNQSPTDDENIRRRDSANVTSEVILKPSKSCVFQPNTTVTSTAKAFEKQHKKTNSIPSYYTVKAILNSPANKYEEHVAKTVVQPMQPIKYKPKVQRPMLPSTNRFQLQKYSTSEDDLLDGQRRQRKKSTNLEDAINELEAIYKSLGLGDENLMDRAERRDIPKFNRFNPVSSFNPGSDDDDIGENAEPDVTLDDVVYRNFKRANSVPKTIEPQPPFGIPIGPIPSTPPGSNYLHASPDNIIAKPMFIARKTPDLVSDDLAVRNLRKDSPVRQVGSVKVEHCIQPSVLRTKQRAVRSMSENIYNLIQRDAAKPSGGCLDDYDVMAGSLNNAASLKDITSGDDTDNTATLRLLQQEQLPEASHRSKGRNVVGAVFSLPSTLKTSPAAKVPFITKQHRPTMILDQKPPIPLPRHNLNSDFACDKSGMEDILNAIAKEAKESSEKLSRDLFELRQEMVNDKNDREIRPVSPKIKLISNVKMEKDIDNVSRAAKRFEELLDDVVDAGIVESKTVKTTETVRSKRSLSKEKRFMQNINDVADAAKACEQVIGMVVDGNRKRAPINASKSPEKETNKIEESKDGTHSVAQLLEKLEPNVHIGAIAERCMRQLSELGDMNIEVVEKKALPLTAASTVDAADYDNLNSNLMKMFNPSEKPITETCSAEQKEPNFRSRVQDEIDKIMQECAEEAEKKCTQQSEAKFVSSDEEINILLLPPAETEIVKAAANDKPCTTPYSSPLDDQNKSSSDYLKSSSATPNRINSSSITSFNEHSSSDFAKSISSDNALASEGIKTTSTTSCEPAQTPSAIQSSTVSPFTISPSPPLVLTPADEDERSLYNSSEELAMIFGIKTPSPSAGNVGVMSLVSTKTLPEHALANNISLPLSDCKSAFINLETIRESHEECAADDEMLCDNASNPTNKPISVNKQQGESACYEFELLGSVAKTDTTDLKKTKMSSSTTISDRINRRRTSSYYPACDSKSTDPSEFCLPVLNPNHLLLSLTVGVMNSDVFTIAAVIIAIFIVIVFIFL